MHGTAARAIEAFHSADVRLSSGTNPPVTQNPTARCVRWEYGCHDLDWRYQSASNVSLGGGRRYQQSQALPTKSGVASKSAVEHWAVSRLATQIEQLDRAHSKLCCHPSHATSLVARYGPHRYQGRTYSRRLRGRCTDAKRPDLQPHGEGCPPPEPPEHLDANQRNTGIAQNI